MTRYFAKIAYLGTPYVGWQNQPNGVAVQQVVEQALQTLLRTPTPVVGCGRTDAGVHASHYVLHFDSAEHLEVGFIQHKLNAILPAAIAVHALVPVHADAHARFDATSRSYIYYLSLQKNPFTPATCYFYPFGKQLDSDKLQAAAALLLQYTEFAPFCKTDHDAHTLRCHLTESVWTIQTDRQRMAYHITANRFLRGMVRLIVGMCLQVASGKLALEQVVTALAQQSPLPKSWSVPPQGLFLTDVRYPYITASFTYHE